MNIARGALALMLSAIAASPCGCATLIYGRYESAPVRSDPPGATVIVDGKPVGDTPLSVKLSRKKSHDVRIEKAGYIGYETTATTTDNAHAAVLESVAPFLFLPLMLIDLADYDTGAVRQIVPNSISAKLLKAPTQTVSDGSNSPEAGAKKAAGSPVFGAESSAPGATPSVTLSPTALPGAGAPPAAAVNSTPTPAAAPTPAPKD